MKGGSAGLRALAGMVSVLVACAGEPEGEDDPAEPVGMQPELVQPGVISTDLAPPINDELSQSDLWVSADERVMILVVTDHPEGFGGDDLYLSRNDGSGWSPPENLGPGINTADYEYGPTLSPDGAFLYFTSHRNGSADVYRIPAEAVLGARRPATQGES